MIDFNAKSQNIGSGRQMTLQRSAYRLRQHAIRSGSDIEGWRLARRMRDADSLPQALAAERDFGIYLRTHALDSTMAA